MSTNAGTLAFLSVADIFCTMPNGFGLLYTNLVSTVFSVALSNIFLSKRLCKYYSVIYRINVDCAVSFTFIRDENSGSGTYLSGSLISVAFIFNQARLLIL